jgi:hypothetical protein
MEIATNLCYGIAMFARVHAVNVTTAERTHTKTSLLTDDMCKDCTFRCVGCNEVFIEDEDPKVICEGSQYGQSCQSAARPYCSDCAWPEDGSPFRKYEGSLYGQFCQSTDEPVTSLIVVLIAHIYKTGIVHTYLFAVAVARWLVWSTILLCTCK